MSQLIGKTINKKKILIVGFGSIGKKHFYASKKLNCDVYVISRSKIDDNNFNPKFIDKSDINKYYFDLIILCNNTNEHIKDLFFFFDFGEKILVEKPLHFKKFNEFELNKLKLMKDVYVAYNLRYLEIIKYLKNELKRKKVDSIETKFWDNCFSWYKDKNIEESYVLKEELGGGAFLTNYHEIDYIKYILSSEIKEVEKKSEFDLEKYTADISCTVNGKLINNILFSSSLSINSNKRERTGKISNGNFKISWDIDKGKVWNDKNEILFNKKTHYLKSYEDQICDILLNKNPKCSTLKSNINDTKIIFK